MPPHRQTASSDESRLSGSTEEYLALAGRPRRNSVKLPTLNPPCGLAGSRGIAVEPKGPDLRSLTPPQGLVDAEYQGAVSPIKCKTNSLGRTRYA